MLVSIDEFEMQQSLRLLAVQLVVEFAAAVASAVVAVGRLVAADVARVVLQLVVVVPALKPVTVNLSVYFLECTSVANIMIILIL